ncbi:MAG: DUF1638 domain-containing protein [Nitrospinota bacterium]|nr:DUF1638 domain-containing protein [Nitrospinota bacterium]
MKIGIVSCAIMRREMEKAIKDCPWISNAIFIEAGKHVRPKELRETVREKIASIKDEVDVILLGYGVCRSLKGIEKEFDIPIVHPEGEDCIAILLTPERYHEELEKSPGTWFMTPGWAELGPQMILNELGLAQRARGLGVDQDEIIRELFAGYSRGLFIDTAVGEPDKFEQMAKQSCDLFNLRLEKTVSDSTALEDSLAKAQIIGGQQEKKED